MSSSTSKIDTSFNDQVAIVTGGSSGLGYAIAKALLSSGASVIILDLKSPNDLTHQEKSDFLKVDITNELEVKDAVDNVWKKNNRIDILVNSAGITGITNLKSHQTDTDNIRKVFDINFMGSYYTSKYVLPYMLQKNYGRILHIASIAGKEGNAGMLAYSSSKAAVIGMTKVQGKEYAETGITVNALAPAVVKTPLVGAMPEEQVRYMTDKIPMKRLGTLKEVADLALYIVSAQNSFTTAFTFDLSGGRATY
jgi:3-oxoacyl-[acyl-carrier protein] reductase